MARFRLAGPAQTDLARILATSLDRWGDDGRSRYARLLAVAMRSIAAAPAGPLTRDRAELSPGVRSLHMQRLKGDHGVNAPMHVVYFRIASPGLIEIVRVLHERMEPTRHITEETRPGRRRRPARRR
jgi:toxin ParE1/3/4